MSLLWHVEERYRNCNIQSWDILSPIHGKSIIWKQGFWESAEATDPVEEVGPHFEPVTAASG